MASDSSSLNKTTINWDSSWQELDLTFGIAINRDGSEQLLEPADYGVIPDGGVQFADVILLGSDSADRVYASFDNHINAKGGNDTLFSIDNYTGNQIVGGTGSDTFYLQATNNLILGGEIFEDFESYSLSSNVALADFEADAYLIESSSEQVSLGQYLKINDFEIGRDSLVIDGLKVDTANWAAARNLLNSNNIDINATPESTLKRITISLLEGATTNTDLAPFILDRDNDSLRAIKITGPEWIELSGTVLTANTPIGITEEDLKAIDLQIGYTDEKAVAPFTAHLTLNTVSLDPIISQLNSGFIQVSDAANSSPASFALQASLTSRATTVTEIGYVILNDGESTTVVDDFKAFKARAKTLFSSLESDDIVLESTMQFEREFLLRNGQKIRFFAVSDATLDDLSGLDDARLSFFDSSIDSLTGQASFSNANGVAFELSLLEGDQDLSALIAQEQTIAPLLDFTAFTNNETVSGSIVQSREADYDAITGFYRVLDTSGSVRAADGSLLTPGDSGYAAAALRDANQVATFSNLSVADGQSSSTDFSLQDSGTFAPFAQVNGNTFFAFSEANADGLSHFRSLGTNLFGLEDQLGGGDLDYDDHIIGFNFTGLS